MAHIKKLNASRLKRLFIFLMVWCLCLYSFMFLSVKAFAVTSISFRSIATYSAYVKANPGVQMLPDSSNSGAKDIQLNTSTSAENIIITDDNNDPELSSIWSAALDAHEAYNSLNNKKPVDNVKYPTAYSQMLVGEAIYNAYGGSQSAFAKDVTKMINKAGGSVTIDPSNGDYQATDSAYDGRLSSAVTSLDAHLVEVATKDTYDRIFDTSDWNPNEGLAADALSVMYNVVNQIFYVVSQVIIWLFFVVCVLDMCYIIVEPSRIILGPFCKRNELHGKGGMDGNNGGFSIHSIFPICLCSDAVVEATGGGDMGGGIGNAGGGKGNAVLIYVRRRAPLLIAAAILIILTVLGYWRYVISWVAGWVIKAINFILNIGG